MTDEELGDKLYRIGAALRISMSDGYNECFAIKARELLAAEKPVATREEIHKWLDENRKQWKNGSQMDDFLLAALAHFAPPAQPVATELPPIYGMTYGDVMEEMHKGKPSNWLSSKYPGEVVAECARVAHRLAQPAPAVVVDPDAEAKRLMETHEQAKPEGWFVTKWQELNEDGKNCWRAVAAAKGKET